MVLSEKWALEKARGLMWNPKYTGFDPVAFTRAIEAEAHKEYEALIRQMLEALENSSDLVFKDTAKADARDLAITAGRARLGRPHD